MLEFLKHFSPRSHHKLFLDHPVFIEKYFKKKKHKNGYIQVRLKSFILQAQRAIL